MISLVVKPRLGQRLPNRTIVRAIVELVMPGTNHASLTIAREVTGHTVIINLGQTDRIIEAVIINPGQTGGTIRVVTIEEIEETIAVSLTVVRPTVAMAEGETLGSVIQEMAEVKTKSSLIMIGYAKSVAM
jgi:hypothetical protein